MIVQSKFRLKTSPNEDDMNSSLINFLSFVIGVPPGNFNIVAGENGRDKLVSIDQVDMEFCASENLRKTWLETLKKVKI